MRHIGGFLTAFAIAVALPGARVGAAQEQLQHHFTEDKSDGFQPYSGLLAGANGHFYGTTVYGGATLAGGTAYELAPVAGGGWTEKVIFRFAGDFGNGDGSQPYGGLVSDGKGNLFGTTSAGGANGSAGTVFELTPVANGEWYEKVLYSFGASDEDGTVPVGGLVFDAKGNLYGTTETGGKNHRHGRAGDGTVFELTPSADGEWTEKVLYNFGDRVADGLYPSAGLVIDDAGNLYGTTTLGGKYSDETAKGGTVFELTRSAGGAWTEKLLHEFNPMGEDGSVPEAGLVLDARGNLYGATRDGGAGGGGTVFELSQAGGGAWAEKVLHEFHFGVVDGNRPYAGVTLDAAGNLYGTTSGGGAYSGRGHAGGTVFELTRQADGSWAEGLLRSFGASATDGNTPTGEVVFDAKGNLYGTSYVGGSRAVGTVFAIGSVVKPAAKTGNPTTATPTFSPAGGTYSVAQTVTIKDATGGAVIYYTTNGATPTTASARYTGPIKISSSTTLKAFAVSTAPHNSAVATAVFTITNTAVKPAVKRVPIATATPTFSLAGGTYPAAQSVTIRDATANAAIYYTTNGAIPTTSSARYTGAIRVSQTETIKAIALAPNDEQSAVATVSFTIN